MTARFVRFASSQLRQAALGMVIVGSMLAAPSGRALAAPSPAPPVAAPTPASAPPPAPLGQVLTGAAKDDYEAAKLVYAEGDFSTAAIKFRRAYDVSRDPRLLWNIAACEKGARHYTKALLLVERYQAEGASLLSEADRKEADGFAAALRATTDTLTLTSNIGDAAVTLDGEAIGKTPIAAPVRVDLGDHHLVITKTGFVTFDQTLAFTGKGVALSVMLAEQVHEGTLRVETDADATLSIDGRLVFTGGNAFKLASGTHTVRVSAKGKKTFDSAVMIQDGQTTSLPVHLESEKSGGAGPWPWIIGGAVIVAGGVLATYFAVHDGKTTEGAGVTGTLGRVEVTK